MHECMLCFSCDVIFLDENRQEIELDRPGDTDVCGPVIVGGDVVIPEPDIVDASTAGDRVKAVSRREDCVGVI